MDRSYKSIKEHLKELYTLSNKQIEFVKEPLIDNIMFITAHGRLTKTDILLHGTAKEYESLLGMEKAIIVLDSMIVDIDKIGENVL